MATTVTSKGQVTIPKPVRDRLGIQAGNAVDFVVRDDGQVLLVKAQDKDFAAAIAKWRGSVGPGLSTDEIMEMTRGE
jgi:AbrB family looped-hinge helix DNA binding protein